MKIYMLGTKGIPARSGGVENHVHNLALELVKMGHDVFVYSRKHYIKRKQKTFSGVSAIYLPTIMRKNLETALHVFLSSIHVLFQNADIIHYHSMGPALFMWIPKLFKPRARILFTYHSYDPGHQKWSRFARIMLNMGAVIGCALADEVFTVSSQMQKFIKEKYGVDALIVGHQVSMYGKRVVARVLKKKSAPIIVVSRLVPHKGIHTLIEAFRATRINRALIIIGGAAYTDGYEAYLKHISRGDPRIKIVGEKYGAALHRYYKNAAIFVQPSQSEGFSVALLEAMSYGKIIISSDIKENKEALGDGALFFRAGDMRDLRRKLLYAHRLSSRLLPKAMKAFARAKEYYLYGLARVKSIYQEA